MNKTFYFNECKENKKSKQNKTFKLSESINNQKYTKC